MNKLNLSFSKKQLSGYIQKFCFTICFLIIAYGPALAQSGSSDFANITWSTATSQPYIVNEAQGEVVNGKLYSFGGFDSRKSCCTPTKRAYVYDPVAGIWTSIADLPYTPNGTNFGGVTHAGITTNGIDIFFAGGYTSNTAGTGQIFGTKQVWKYIVSQNSYIRLPDLPVSISSGQLEYLNNKLHHIGGTNSSRTVDLGDHYVLDLNNTAAGWKTMAPLPNPRQHAGSAVYGGKIYFIGGQHHQDGALMTQKDVHLFNPLNNTWTKVADLPVPTGATGRGHISSGVVVMGERILVLGGETKHGTSTNMVSAHSPATNSWKNLTPLPVNRHSGVAGTMNGIIYYCAGSNSNTTYKGVPAGGQQVISFTLINADTDNDIQPLNSGTTLNLATLPTKNLNIRANTSPATVGSVIFALSGTQTKSQTESSAPYALYGNNGSDYNPWTPPVGNYALKATPYSGSGGSGTAGTPLTINFSVVNSTGGSGQQVVSFTLINADTDNDIQALNNGATLNLATLPTKNLNIRANTNPAIVGSVIFALSGTQSKSQTESGAPYALYGNNGSNYNPWTPPVGNYTLKATPYTASGGSGTAGTPLTINFNVVNSTTTQPLVTNITSDTGHQERNEGLQLQAYPNPVPGDKVYVALKSQSGKEAVSITMYDASGKVIKSKTLITDNNGIGRTEIPVRGINRGFYIIKAKSVSGNKQVQVVIE